VINIKKILFLIILLIISFTKVNAVIDDGMFITIGNKAITKSDIVNEIKIILLLNNKVYSSSNKEELREIAITTILKRNIKLNEIEKYNLTQYSKADLINELERLANNINVDLDTLKNVFSSNNVKFKLIEDQIKIELLWNSLIFELYKDKLKINPVEIEDQLKKENESKKKIEYLISEILINVENITNVDEEIKKIKNRINIESFETVAESISDSPSSAIGGNLGWIKESELSEKIKLVVMTTKIGSVSKPIFLSNDILLYQIRDKRKVKETLTLEEKKNQIVNYEKTKILNMYSLSHYDKVRRSISVRFHQ
jgi:peptidyl-prolyl cis-trans isomerase SurA